MRTKSRYTCRVPLNMVSAEKIIGQVIHVVKWLTISFSFVKVFELFISNEIDFYSVYSSKGASGYYQDASGLHANSFQHEA